MDGQKEKKGEGECFDRRILHRPEEKKGDEEGGKKIKEKMRVRS